MLCSRVIIGFSDSVVTMILMLQILLVLAKCVHSVEYRTKKYKLPTLHSPSKRPKKLKNTGKDIINDRIQSDNN